MAKSVITIGRQYGSGGREIGNIVAEKLGIPVIDKKILAVVAEECDIDPEILESKPEDVSINSFLYSLVLDSRSSGSVEDVLDGIPLNHRIFLAQMNAIKKVAEEGPCVIIGRCADYALAEHPNLLSVFIHADLETRINRVRRRKNLDYTDAKHMIVQTDKTRASYYNYYTTKKWGEVSSYDLCLNSAKLGVEDAAQIILDYTQMYEKLGSKPVI